MPLKTVQDQIQNLRERKNGAMEDLVNTYTQPLMAGAFAMGFLDFDAEELVQQTFVAFLSAVDRFEGRAQLKTYLFGILYNKASEMRRKRQKEESLDNTEDVFEKRFNPAGIWNSPPRGPEDTALTNEIQAWIEKCSENLPIQHRTAFFLKEVEKESSDTICNILGISYTHLRVLMHRARIKLRECLEKKWGSS
ncbi:MAG: sigma-70 family RNA polymerase sigma factor [Elusimicrobia bacterium]|nr:sigma-70 family RNA polymerase sigma factor [Elusimicrobiota bacterium]